MPTGRFDGAIVEHTPTAHSVFVVCCHSRAGFDAVIGLDIGLDLHLQLRRIENDNGI